MPKAKTQGRLAAQKVEPKGRLADKDVHVRMTAKTLRSLERIKREQPGIASRSAAIRYLTEQHDSAARARKTSPPGD